MPPGTTPSSSSATWSACRTEEVWLLSTGRTFAAVKRPLAIAAVLGLTGIVWILQGFGYLPGSFMTGDPTWAYIGAAVLIGAVLLASSAYRRHGR